MLIAANKYSDVRARAAQPGSSTVQTPPRASDSSHRRQAPKGSAPALFIPRHKDLCNWDEWMWRELRDGGRLNEYLRREKATSGRRLRSVARRMHGYRANPKSDLRLIAAVPAREYHRWRGEDRDFWSDDSNLRSWRRDNPDAAVFL